MQLQGKSHSAIKQELLAKRLQGKLKKPIAVEPAEIAPQPRGGRQPLSYAEQRLWFLEQFEGGHAAYNIPIGFRLTGPLNPHALELTLKQIVQRHDILRASFHNEDGQPRKIIAERLSLVLPVNDLREKRAKEQQAEIERLVMQDARTPFHLDEAPLFRLRLFRLANKEYELYLTIHHIIFDGWSFGVFLDELSGMYEAFLQGRPSPFPPLARQYADFIAWQQERMTGKAMQRQAAYWKRQLARRLPTLDLPTDRPRPPMQTFAGALHAFALPDALAADLRNLARQERATLFMILLAAFNVLLYRYTGQEDVIVGAPAANRADVNFEPLIGFFVNTLAMRSDLSGNPTFRDLLRRAQIMSHEALANQEMPFDLLVTELNPDRNMSHQAIFQVMFVLQNMPLEPLKLPGVKVEPIHIHNGAAKFDITLEMIETKQGLNGIFEYNANLFDKDTIIRMADHFVTLLHSLIANPDRHIAELQILTDAERSQILDKWNATDTTYRHDRCIHELFEEQTQQTPDAIAVVCGDRQLTYRELNQRANQLARYLRNLGVMPDVRVAICIDRSIEMVVGLLGILKAGGAYVPLDPAYPKERLAFMLEDAESSVLLTQNAYRAELPAKAKHIVCLDTDWDAFSELNSENLSSGVTPNNLIYVIYTSGSTGKPKGAGVYHRGFANLLNWFVTQFRISAQDSVLLISSFNFDLTQKNIFAPLIRGGVLHLPSFRIYDPNDIIRIVQRQNISWLNCTPSAFKALVDCGVEHGFKELESLRYVFLGGEPLVVRHFREWIDSGRCHAKFVNTYGPTECTDISNSYVIEHPADFFDRSTPIGKPIFNVNVLILDHFYNLLPVGIAGELCITGAGVGAGYLNNQALTEEKFIPLHYSQFSTPNVYKTGDLARYLPDGNIEYLGRIDHQVKIRGFRIELGEIEAILLKHSTIEEAVVVARNSTELAAYLISKPEQTVTIAELRTFLAQELPDYMIPSSFTFLEALPLTPNGKVDRRALPEPETTNIEAAEVDLPRNPIEEQLAEMWKQLLERERIGIHDTFFNVGGHSLLVMKTLADIRNAWGISLSVQQFFETPTIAGLAQRVRQLSVKTPVVEPDVIDLRREICLDEQISPPTAWRVEQIAAPAAILLTGATGFFGAFLLHELLMQTDARIYCLARSADSADGLARIRANAARYFLWHEYAAPRVIPVCGDLAAPRLGLADERFDELADAVDVIYHNGALVNFAYPYAALKPANVLGTAEILRLACQNRTKPVQYVSTVSVFDKGGCDPETPIEEAAALDALSEHALGYAQSKWVAEKIVLLARERGVPVAVYRPGRISGQSQTGAWNVDDFLCLLIKGCLQLGSIPDRYSRLVDLVPGDYAAKAMAHLAKQPASLGQNFHLVNPQPMRWTDFVSVLCSFYPRLRSVPYDIWQTELILRTTTQENVLAPLLPLFLEPDLPAEPEYFSCRQTLAGLKGTSVACPPVDAGLLYTYLAYLIRSGFLPTPIR